MPVKAPSAASTVAGCQLAEPAPANGSRRDPVCPVARASPEHLGHAAGASTRKPTAGTYEASSIAMPSAFLPASRLNQPARRSRSQSCFVPANFRRRRFRDVRPPRRLPRANRANRAAYGMYSAEVDRSSRNTRAKYRSSIHPHHAAPHARPRRGNVATVTPTRFCAAGGRAAPKRAYRLHKTMPFPALPAAPARRRSARRRWLRAAP